jgi:ABC-type phosphate/phosphonate transport system substrate-binding protein
VSQLKIAMGAVAYAPKVVTIWEGFKAWFAQRGLHFDYVLFSNYEAQVQAQFDGTIQLAWNSPLAYVRAVRMARARNQTVTALAMRDTDRNLRSVIVARTDGPVRSLSDLRGRIVGVGAIDSPQATLLPLQHLRSAGLIAGTDFRVRRFDLLGGKHGDHIGGERDAALALLARQVDACCMIDGNHLAFSLDGTLPAGETRVLAQTDPYDHCNMTASPGIGVEALKPYVDGLLTMRWDDPQVRPLLELEGLRQWLPGRVSGYEELAKAVDADGFYDADGRILHADYRY